MYRRQSTIHDVARLAGVSVTTVSYVFNGRGGISDATKRRVREAAARLHYSPNGLIRSLQQRRTNLIGAYLWAPGPDPSPFIAGPLLHGVWEALAETPYDLLLYSHKPGRFEEANVTSFLDKRVDGLLWAPAPTAFGALDQLAAAGLPTVALLQHPVPEGIGQARVDDEGGAAVAVRHLLDLGHRRIAISGSHRISSFSERLAGYRQALAAGEAPRGPELEIVPPDAYTDPAEVLQRVRAARATALFCVTDSHALGVLRAARRLGVAVPQELSIVGFDDVPAAALQDPPLTTVRLPAVELGREAVRRLVARIEGSPVENEAGPLPVSLQARGSSGPPPSP